MPDFVLILYNDAISTSYYVVKWQHDSLLAYNVHTYMLAACIVPVPEALKER